MSNHDNTSHPCLAAINDWFSSGCIIVVRRAERFAVPGAAAGRLLVEHRLGESQPNKRGLSEFNPSVFSNRVFSNSESGGV